MRKSLILFSVAMLMFFISCDKNKTDNFDINSTGVLFTYNYSTEPILNISDTLSEGEIIWYEFDAVAGEVYDLSWYERVLTFSESSYSTDNTYASIFVSAFHENKTDAYFTDEKIISEEASIHQIVIAPSNEKVYIKITATNSGMGGKFMFYANHLVMKPETIKKVNNAEQFKVNACETKIFCINAIKYETYEVFCTQITPSGIYAGTALEIVTTAYFNSTDYCYNKPDLCYNKTISMLAPENGRIFLFFSGPYTGDSAIFEIEETNK